MKHNCITPPFLTACILLCSHISQAQAQQALQVQANTIPPAYHTVAREHGIPVRLLYAIALAESGITKKGVYHPWPWTLNIAGKAARFETKTQAGLALQHAVTTGQSVDVGLMQINVRWHQQRVNRPYDLLDPWISLKTAAHILLEQKTTTRDWWDTVGRYHAPGNDKASRHRANRYRQRVHDLYLQSERHE